MPTEPSHQGCAAIHAIASTQSSCSRSAVLVQDDPVRVAGAADVDAHARIAVAGEVPHLLVVADRDAVVPAVREVAEDGRHRAWHRPGSQRRRRQPGSVGERDPFVLDDADVVREVGADADVLGIKSAFELGTTARRAYVVCKT